MLVSLSNTKIVSSFKSAVEYPPFIIVINLALRNDFRNIPRF